MRRSQSNDTMTIVIASSAQGCGADRTSYLPKFRMDFWKEIHLASESKLSVSIGSGANKYFYSDYFRLSKILK